jgi:hypothetical protein
MSRAPRPARPLSRHTQIRWRILLRQTEQHRRHEAAALVERQPGNAPR